METIIITVLGYIGYVTYNLVSKVIGGNSGCPVPEGDTIGDVSMDSCSTICM